MLHTVCMPGVCSLAVNVRRHRQGQVPELRTHSSVILYDTVEGAAAYMGAAQRMRRLGVAKSLGKVPWWNFFWCFVAPALAAKHWLGSTLWAGFLIAGMLRYVAVLNFTWCVNSLVHHVGERPY